MYVFVNALKPQNMLLTGQQAAPGISPFVGIPDGCRYWRCNNFCYSIWLISKALSAPLPPQTAELCEAGVLRLIQQL